MSVFTKPKEKIPIELKSSWNEIAPELVAKKPNKPKPTVENENINILEESNDVEENSSSDYLPVEIETQKLDIPKENNVKKEIDDPMKDIFINESEILIKELLYELQNPLPECNERNINDYCNKIFKRYTAIAKLNHFLALDKSFQEIIINNIDYSILIGIYKDLNHFLKSMRVISFIFLVLFCRNNGRSQVMIINILNHCVTIQGLLIFYHKCINLDEKSDDLRMKNVFKLRKKYIYEIPNAIHLDKRLESHPVSLVNNEFDYCYMSKNGIECKEFPIDPQNYLLLLPIKVDRVYAILNAPYNNNNINNNNNNKRFDIDSTMLLKLYSEYNKISKKCKGKVYSKDLIKNKIIKENISDIENLLSYYGDDVPVTFYDLLLFDSFRKYENKMKKQEEFIESSEQIQIYQNNKIKIENITMSITIMANLKDECLEVGCERIKTNELYSLVIPIDILHIKDPNPFSLCTLSSASINKIISKLHLSGENDGFLLSLIVNEDKEDEIVISPIDECRKSIYRSLIDVQNNITEYYKSKNMENELCSSPYESDNEEESRIYKENDEIVDWNEIVINIEFDGIKNNKELMESLYSMLNKTIIENSNVLLSHPLFKYVILLDLAKSRLAKISGHKVEMMEYLWDVLLDYLHDTIKDLPEKLYYLKEIKKEETIKLYRTILAKYRVIAKEKKEKANLEEIERLEKKFEDDMNKYKEMKDNTEKEHYLVVCNSYQESWRKAAEREEKEYKEFLKTRPKEVDYKEMIKYEMGKRIHESRKAWEIRKEEIKEENDYIAEWNKGDRKKRKEIYHNRMKALAAEREERKRFERACERILPLNEVFQYYKIPESEITEINMNNIMKKLYNFNHPYKVKPKPERIPRVPISQLDEFRDLLQLYIYRKPQIVESPRLVPVVEEDGMLRSYNSIDQLLSLLSEDEYDSSLSPDSTNYEEFKRELQRISEK